MSKVTRVSNGDYKIIIQDGGTITLDTTNGTNNLNGRVVITGSLEVLGTRTYVESTDLRIEDNIILLTKDNSSAGIPASLNYRSGIEIERGTSPNATFVYDEQIAWAAGGDSANGTFTFEVNGNTIPIKTRGIVSDGAIYFTPGGSGALSVTNTSDYEEKVLTYSGGAITDSGSGVIIDDDLLPNTKAMVDYVDYIINSTFQSRIDEGDTFAEAEDFDVTGLESRVTVGVDGSIVATFFTNRTEIQDIQISGTTIETTVSNSDLILSSSGTGTVKIKDSLEITETPADDDVLSDPLKPTEGLKLYSKTEDTGGTGLYFVNKTNTRDEIISNNRSLVYSMLF